MLGPNTKILFEVYPNLDQIPRKIFFADPKPDWQHEKLTATRPDPMHGFLVTYFWQYKKSAFLFIVQYAFQNHREMRFYFFVRASENFKSISSVITLDIIEATNFNFEPQVR